jgi:hypothetical protein
MACVSTDGGRCANVPTAPEIFPNEMVARAASRRVRARFSSSNQMASLWPKLIGSAWMPWLRPIIGVFLCSNARASTAFSTRSTPPMINVIASRRIKASEVSSTSLDVMPQCSQRASGPMRSSMNVRKAITSCLVVFSISSIFVTSAAEKSPAFAWHFSKASFGAMPSATMPSSAASSTSLQRRRRASGVQRATISARL